MRRSRTLKGSRSWQRQQRKKILRIELRRLPRKPGIMEPITEHRKSMGLFWRILLGHGLSPHFFVCPRLHCFEAFDTKRQYERHYRSTHQNKTAK